MNIKRFFSYTVYTQISCLIKESAFLLKCQTDPAAAGQVY